MNIPLSEKERMLTMLTEIYDQLEELESVLEASFSDQRHLLNNEEQEKIALTLHRLADIGGKSAEQVNPITYEEILDTSIGPVPKSLKLELGF
ncbi:hypothetical protein [Neobacillus cucumis]|uniref:Uncharacterized protein n=1 Tax=Neobacillus cucumis TaxID=1740721 RepID=A0A2N5HDN1_9BACI|nr:hypothetical protein [Neobacillus cucumis]PLS03573.1 hypothetical protein CVD27_14420 [Neobacillus cucumis]